MVRSRARRTSADDPDAFLVYGVGGLVVPTVVIGTMFWVKRKDWF